MDQFTYKSNLFLFTLFFLQAISIYGAMLALGLIDHFIPTLYSSILYLGLAIGLLIKFLTKDRQSEKLFNSSTLISILVPSISIPIFISLFSSMKSVIPMINPFYLDEVLMKADQFIHFGFHPWQITHALFGDRFLTTFLDLSYNLWFVVMYIFTIWTILNVKRPKERMHYLIAFFLIWTVLGLISAGLLSSAGPVYYGDIVGEGAYQTLMETLASHNLHASGLQGRLWSDYINGNTNIGSGISAMPSMHVAQTMLMYLAARHVSRALSYAMLGFLIIIMIGSVHLGWHYALDGYISVIMVTLLWKVSGKIVILLDINNNKEENPCFLMPKPSNSLMKETITLDATPKKQTS